MPDAKQTKPALLVESFRRIIHHESTTTSMSKSFSFILINLIALFFSASLFASSSLPLSLDERIVRAKAIFRGTVLEKISFRNPADNGIYTRTILRVDEALKGRFPQNIQLIHRGGVVDGEGEIDSFAPKFQVEEVRLVFLDARNDGTLFAYDGGPSAILLHRPENAGGKAGADGGKFSPAEMALLEEIRRNVSSPSTQGIDTTGQVGFLTGQSTSLVGGLLETSGISSRFTKPDRGEKIGYIVDAQTLPPGISLSQALGAVSNALDAWSQVSSVQFVYEGLQNFGTNAASVLINDGKIRIQLHDLYGYITGANTLGIGGRSASIPGGFGSAGGFGGNVAGREFFLNSRGYLTLKHTQVSMQTLSTFEEVLCHEMGHVLSLDHSSETQGEADATLAGAMMYFQVHGGGRGATLGAYDPPKIRLVHPLNTPPYGYDRMMDIVNSPTAPPNVVGINEVDLRGYDLQDDTLTLALTNQTAANGAFSLAGQILKFTPAGYFGDAPRLDPAGTSAYDRAYARFSDGTNGSPFIQVRVVSFLGDTMPGFANGGSDGIPDSWMTQYFNNIDPNIGTKHHASDDFDGDGISNLNEFISGTNPTNVNSALKITSFSKTNLQFVARPYDVYEIQTSQDFLSWSLATNPVTPTVTNASYSGFTNPTASRQFFRLLRVP